jgi:hypothetical protein
LEQVAPHPAKRLPSYAQNARWRGVTRRAARCGASRWRCADKPGIDDAFEVIGVASAEIAVEDADRGHPALFRFGNRDFGAAIDCDISDIVAAIDEGGDGRFVYDGDG